MADVHGTSDLIPYVKSTLAHTRKHSHELGLGRQPWGAYSYELHLRHGSAPRFAHGALCPLHVLEVETSGHVPHAQPDLNGSPQSILDIGQGLF